MKRIALFVFAWLIVSGFPLRMEAYFDPLAKPNNFHGIHILFPSELESANELVNSDSGKWGYVTIPIQTGDRDLEKWQKFMDECKKLQVIPILRLSTEADYQNTSVWSIPTEEDILDFANFLNSLDWPIENRYIVVFNEVNRFDEWGGQTPDPKKYADLLSYAVDTFKSKSGDFYVIMAGLDNAAPNDQKDYYDNFFYIREMADYNPEVFKKIDGFASHSYPNPDFSQPPLPGKREGITTYQFEYELINSYSEKKVPAFILETGWHSEKLGEAKVAEYYKTAYSEIWDKDKDKIVAITPFLLNSQGGSFDTFSFIRNGQETQYYKYATESEKVKGEPIIKAVQQIATAQVSALQTKTFNRVSLANTMGNELVINYIKFFF